MERFIHNENIRRYRALLESEQDEEKRNLIRKLHGGGIKASFSQFEAER
jgi:hypothetical protein